MEPKTLAGETVGRLEELQVEETIPHRTLQEATRETGGTVPVPRNAPTLVAHHPQGVGRHREEIRHLLTPPTTRATPVVRAATSRT